MPSCQTFPLPQPFFQLAIPIDAGVARLAARQNVIAEADPKLNAVTSSSYALGTGVIFRSLAPAFKIGSAGQFKAVGGFCLVNVS